MLVDLLGRSDLLDPALVEDGDPVAHRERFFLVVRDVEEGDADALLDRLELDLHLLAELQVERAERLVEQKHARRVDDRARERDALALASRELHRLARAEVFQPDEAQSLRRALVAVGVLDALHPQPVGDVLQDAHVREQGVVLEHRVHVAQIGRRRADVLSSELDRA